MKKVKCPCKGAAKKVSVVIGVIAGVGALIAGGVALYNKFILGKEGAEEPEEPDAFEEMEEAEAEAEAEAEEKTESEAEEEAAEEEAEAAAEDTDAE